MPRVVAERWKPAFAIALVALAAWWADSATPASSGDVIWRATHESGSYADWHDRQGAGWAGCGGHADSGGVSVIDGTRARTGRYSLRMTVHAPPGQGEVGTRNFRWCGPKGRTLPVDAVYEAWFYLDRNFRPAVWWNIFQFKTRTSYGLSEPNWTLNVYRDARGMGLYWYDLGGLAREGNSGSGSFNPGVWHHVEVRYRYGETDGFIIAKLDGRQWYARRGVRTKWSNAFKPDEHQWSVNNYTSGITPSKATIWVDDASISRP